MKVISMQYIALEKKIKRLSFNATTTLSDNKMFITCPAFTEQKASCNSNFRFFKQISTFAKSSTFHYDCGTFSIMSHNTKHKMAIQIEIKNQHLTFSPQL